MDDVSVSRNEDRSRYEATYDGHLAGFAEYRTRGDVVEFPHTVTDPAFRGKGIASALAKRSLDDAAEGGLRVQPTCSFYAAYIGRHPEYADLLA